MEVTEKFPQWVKFRTDDMGGPVGRYVIGPGDDAGWASYGRFFALRQMLATTPQAYIDVSDARSLGYLSRTLGFSRPARCREWLEMLVCCDAIDAEAWGRGGCSRGRCGTSRSSTRAAAGSSPRTARRGEGRRLRRPTGRADARLSKPTENQTAFRMVCGLVFSSQATHENPRTRRTGRGEPDLNQPKTFSLYNKIRLDIEKPSTFLVSGACRKLARMSKDPRPARVATVVG